MKKQIKIKIKNKIKIQEQLKNKIKNYSFNFSHFFNRFNHFNFNNYLGIILVLLAFFVVLLFLNSLNPFLLWDENVYLGNARNIIGISNSIEDFRFPLIEQIVGFFWFFTGESIFIAKFVSIIFSLLCLLFFYLILNQLFNSSRINLLFTIFFGLSEIFLYWGFRVYPDMMGLTFSLISIYFLFKWIKNKDNLFFGVLSLLFSVFAFLSRFSYILLIFSIMLFLFLFFVQKLYLKKIKINSFCILFIIFIFSLLFFLLPWLIYNLINYQNPIWDFLFYQSAISQWTVNQPIFLELRNIWKAVNVLIIFIIPGFIYSYKKIKEKNFQFSFILFYFLLSFIYYTFFVRLKDERYILSILPFFFILFISGIIEIKNKIKEIKEIKNNKKKNILNLMITFFVILFFFGYLLINIPVYEENLFSPCFFNIQTSDNALLSSIEYIESNNLLNENSTILSNYWPYYAYYFNVKAYSLWGKLDNLILEYHPSVLIIREDDGTEYNSEEIRQALNNNQIIFEKEFVDSCGGQIIVYAINLSIE